MATEGSGSVSESRGEEVGEVHFFLRGFPSFGSSRGEGWGFQDGRTTLDWKDESMLALCVSAARRVSFL